MLPLLLVGLRSLFVSAAEDIDDDDGIVEDEVTKPGHIPFPGGKMPSADELLKMLDSMQGISDEDKEALRQDLLKRAQAAGDDVGSAFAEDTTAHLATSIFTSQLFILLALLTLISLIFVFFGYKLYKSLSERERKREEKKKNKQMKKKK